MDEYNSISWDAIYPDQELGMGNGYDNWFLNNSYADPYSLDLVYNPTTDYVPDYTPNFNDPLGLNGVPSEYDPFGYKRDSGFYAPWDPQMMDGTNDASLYVDAMGNTIITGSDGSILGTITADGTVFDPYDKPVTEGSSLWGKLTDVVGKIDWSKLAYSGTQALGSYLGANKQAQTAADQLAFTKAQSAQQQAMLAPYVGTGVNALANTVNMASQPTPTFAYNPNEFYQSPVFQNLYAAGIAPVMAEASKAGMYGSGNMANALMERGQQIGAQYMPLDQQIQQQNYANFLAANQQDYARQAGLASTGLEAAGRATTLGQNATQMANGIMSNLGDAQAQGIQAPVNALGSYFGSDNSKQMTYPITLMRG